MKEFSYESGMGTITVFHVLLYDFESYKVQRNGQYFIDLKKVDGIWKIQNPVPAGFYTDDILAIGDEIDKRITT